MPKKTTKADAEQWLTVNVPHFSILEWGGTARAKSSFRNNETDSVVNYTFSDLKREIGEGRSLGTSILPKKTAIDWLKNNAPHIELIKWSGRASKPSRFLDKNRGVYFDYDFKNLKGEIKRNPGCLFGASKDELFEKVKKTNIKRYGTSTFLKTSEFKEKNRKTCLKKYGTIHSSKSLKIKDKVIKTKIEKGLIKIINGKTIKEIAKEKGCSSSHLLNLSKNFSDNFILSYSKNETSIECVLSNFLKSQNIDYEKDKKISNFRYDFLIPENKLIIECDGLMWHSDTAVGSFSNAKDKNYHLNKKNEYKKFGYDSLFFREDEILNKFPIVESIILNKIGLSRKIYARKCEIKEVQKEEGKEFIESNHLMGKGSGRIFGLYFNNNLVACMQVKWKNKLDKVLEVSRFCTKQNVSVVGGWSKLVSFVLKEFDPLEIMTFVDKRYGSGEYLEKLGWIKESEHLSFAWTDYKTTFHRMNFPGNSGYENGMAKIWDCGQAKFVKKNRN